MILAGDIGGTKTELALFERRNDRLEPVHQVRWPSALEARFDAFLARFLAEAEAPRIDAACLGVAGPVVDGRSEATNLPWVLEEAELARQTGARAVRLLNDLQAAAYGMLRLPGDELHDLTPGLVPPARRNRAVVAAGTGLGEALLFWDGARHHPVASEAGHADFAPRDAREDRLLGFLRGRFPEHVSWERVLSGPGVRLLYEFVVEVEGRPASAEVERRVAAGEDPSAAVSGAALDAGDPTGRAALDLFASVYGAEAGNAALRWLATGGVYIGGGIAPKVLPALRAPGFLEAFRAKGRFRPLLEQIPVRVVLQQRVALLGAAHYALDL